MASFTDIGADILDSTNQNVFSFGILEEQDTWWELCPNQRAYFEYMQHLNGYLREEYHSLSVFEAFRRYVAITLSLIAFELSRLESHIQRYAAQGQPAHGIQFTRAFSCTE